jgi:uncharacterized membrane-anchored protein YhcB (DUF1043 family)
MQRFAYLFIGLLIGGGVGYLPLRQQYNAQQAAFEQQQDSLRKELTRTQEKARLSEVVGRLGILLVKAEQRDYAAARERSTRFFDSLREAVSSAQDAKTNETLAQTLNRRDEITADLAMSDDRVIPKLRELYSNLQELAGP